MGLAKGGIELYSTCCQSPILASSFFFGNKAFFLPFAFASPISIMSELYFW
jgi:hypothetical protein